MSIDPAVGIAVGTGAGVAIGVATGDVPVWTASGASPCVALSAVLRLRSSDERGGS